MKLNAEKALIIRSLARDLGEKLGTYAHISVLRRTAVGHFNEKSTISLEKLKKLVHSARPSEDIEGILPVEAVLDDIPVHHLNPALSTRFKNGQAVIITEDLVQGNRVGVNAKR